MRALLASERRWENRHRTFRASNIMTVSDWKHCGSRVFLIFLAAFQAVAEELRIADLQLLETNEVWRIQWSSVAGVDYQLQRTRDDVLKSDGPIEWVSLTT